MKNHFAQKRDEVEPDIVKVLRKRGAFVHKLNRFDLLVGWQGKWYPLEVKSGNKKLTDRQVKDILELKNIAPFYVVRDVEEALNIIFGD